MALKTYVRYSHPNRNFLTHLGSRSYVKAVATFSWLFVLFALAVNVSFNYFSHRVSGQTLALAGNDNEQFAKGEVEGTFTGNQTGTTVPKSQGDKTQEDKDLMEETKRTPRKSTFKVALFGDSMIDTMGSKVQALENSLKKKYPDTVFVFYNYGQGAENVEMGVSRFEKPFVYSDRSYPPLSALDADIIILGSFAYNPFAPFDRDKHWLQLAKLIEKAKSTKAEVYLLAEISPLRLDFARGPSGLNWDSVTAYEKSGEVIQQLENAVGLAKNLNVILINVFEKSQVSARGDGKKEYVSSKDGIHPSEAGHNFTAEQIAETLVLD